MRAKLDSRHYVLGGALLSTAVFGFPVFCLVCPIGLTFATVLVVWRPGTEGGSAVVDVLTGKENPSGRLPMSFPYCVGQVPVHYNEFSTGRPDRKGIQERFRSKYLDIPNEPLYPFGYGLGYTRFSLSQVKLDKTEMREGDTIHAGVMLKNIRERKGTETVQFYIRDMAASVVRPVRAERV